MHSPGDIFSSYNINTETEQAPHRALRSGLPGWDARRATRGR